jgi:hypothetical protein
MASSSSSPWRTAMASSAAPLQLPLLVEHGDRFRVHHPEALHVVSDHAAPGVILVGRDQPLHAAPRQLQSFGIGFPFLDL